MNNNYDLNNGYNVENQESNRTISNVNNGVVNNSGNQPNNLGNYNQTLQNNLSNNSNSENMAYNSSTVSNNESLKNNKKKNKTGFIIAIVIIAIILISWGTKILISAVATKQIGSAVSTAKLNSIIDEYKMIEKNVETFLYTEQTVTCDSDCYKLYDYDEEKYDVKVTDKNSYYQIELKAIGEIYKGVNLDSDKCKRLSNIVCKGNVITGKVYKISE